MSQAPTDLTSELAPYIPHRILERLADRQPDHPLIEFTDDRVYSAGEVDAMSSQVAAALQRAGLAPGDRVALMIGNRVEFLAWWIGAAKAGIVSVPLNTAMRGDVLTHMLTLSTPSLLVVDPELVEDARASVRDLARQPLLLVVSGVGGEGTTADYLDGAGSPAFVDAEPSTFASIMFTSGTTGPSKGVMWTHRMSMGKAESAIAVMGHRSDDVLFTCLPLFHANGLCTSFLPALVVGARLVVAPRFSASGFWPAINAAGATVTNMLGSMGPMLWKRDAGPEERSHRLRKALVIPPPVGYVEEFERRFNLECTQLYGSTDVGVPIGVPDGERQPDSCGKVLPGWECVIVDEHDEPVPDGQAGELLVRPMRPFISQLGYYGMPEATVSAWRNLWFHTGDVMKRDADGWHYFLDRAKDAMRRSGENISSYEVEQVVLAHEAVADVAAFAVPSEFVEDEVMVAIVLHPDRADTTYAEIATWCRDRLPYFAVPRYLEFVDELPRTATAKIQKTTLRSRGVTQSTHDSGPSNRSAAVRATAAQP